MVAVQCSLALQMELSDNFIQKPILLPSSGSPLLVVVATLAIDLPWTRVMHDIKSTINATWGFRKFMMRLGHGAIFVLRCIILLPGIHGAVLNLHVAWQQSSKLEFTHAGAYHCLAALWATTSSASLLIFADDSIVSRRSNDPIATRTRRPLTSLLAFCLWYLFSIYRIYSGMYSPVLGWALATIGPSIGNFGRRYYAVSHDMEVLPSKEGSPFPKQSRWKTAFLRKEVFTIFGATLLTIALLLHQYAEQRFLNEGHRAHSAALGRAMPPFPHPSKSLVNPIRVLILITSSWMTQAYSDRELVRRTSVRLVPASSAHLVMEYRFVLGSTPSSVGDFRTPKEIDEELSKHRDLLIVPTGDNHDNLTHKVYSSMAWADQYTFDYIVKTDSDVFVRWDTLADEFIEQGRKKKYWRGLSFWNMPQAPSENQDDEIHTGEISPLPQFTFGTLYILSRDIVRLVTSPAKHRVFAHEEDHALGIWLDEAGITAIHDRRINAEANACRDDMIAKHISLDKISTADEGMDAMYKNVKGNKPLCEGFATDSCPYCYSCWKPSESMPATCDREKGLIFVEGSKLPAAAPKAVNPPDVKLAPKTTPWLVPEIISISGSPLSNSSDWNRLYWLIWMSKVDDFEARHYSAIDLILISNPQAIVTVVSSTLPSDFFAAYGRHGYSVHVIPMSKELIVEREWYTGPNTEAWISQWDTWEHDSPYFADHLADYLRYVLIYRYGGTCLGFDTLWLRSPYSELEFISSDYSRSDADQDWKLNTENGLVMSNEIMRCQAGSDLFRTIAESAFEIKGYQPGCLNCVGARPTTSYVKSNQHDLEVRGLALLAPEVHYPYAIQEIQDVLRMGRGDDAKDRTLATLRTVYQYSWSLNLYGKTTDKLEIAPNSTIGILLDSLRLDVPHPPGVSSIGAALPESNTPVMKELSLQAPESYTYSNSSQIKAASLLIPTAMTLSEQIQMSGRQLTNLGPSLDGAWEGLERIFVRGGPEDVSSATIAMKLRCAGQHHEDELIGKLSLGTDETQTLNGGLWQQELNVSLGGAKGNGQQVTKKEINVILSSLKYRPPQRPSGSAASSEESGEELVITITYGDEPPQQKIITIVSD
ncbi:hypothetical protein PVAG01_00821 [Phlyctema vagabunda]|uniref:Uncharacterized protein n=1 Tax=Phlyctema vagabunda TaxID=108571 RepID=A0ABR4PVY3_9HELO